jgi:hypothetical protein
VALLHAHNALLETQNKHGNRALHLAALRSRSTACTQLLVLGADINAVNQDSMTALQCCESTKPDTTRRIQRALIDWKNASQRSFVTQTRTARNACLLGHWTDMRLFDFNIVPLIAAYITYKKKPSRKQKSEEKGNN